MKVKQLVGVLVILSCLVGPAWAKGGNGNGGAGTATLTAEEAGNLTFLFEEEKMARDVYQYFFDIYGAVIFGNISASEQRHMDAVEGLLIKYKQAVPKLFDNLCEYENGDLTTLCNDLITQGETLPGALQSGVDIEEIDIGDIQLMMGETIKTDVIQVLGNLLDGSGNHLDSFTQSLNLLEVQ